ncbi:hypothetical protein OIU74_026467 [Salix koriyanagi]|uniref:Uncharacterized protein n=1 Tax=Salix koriyanagi TaxID=2511006 RepID=A0A9Q0VYQ0_9ROSI|nr:hypothetical protein OIU74_026467 [Salix koriyanagi]
MMLMDHQLSRTYRKGNKNNKVWLLHDTITGISNINCHLHKWFLLEKECDMRTKIWWKGKRYWHYQLHESIPVQHTHLITLVLVIKHKPSSG